MMNTVLQIVSITRSFRRRQCSGAAAIPSTCVQNLDSVIGFFFSPAFLRCSCFAASRPDGLRLSTFSSRRKFTLISASTRIQQIRRIGTVQILHLISCLPSTTRRRTTTASRNRRCSTWRTLLQRPFHR